jgi:hypothetical protein
MSTIKLFRLISKIFDLHLPYLTTTLHLQLEFALWICTILFTVASSRVLYKHSFLSTYGDWVFLSWIGAWLGRHFFLRLVCTITLIDLPGNHWRGGMSHSHYGGSWRRRRAFHSWLHFHRRQQSLYHRIRWLLRLFSPYNIAVMLVEFIQTCSMAGQYCDSSAANGVASAATMMLVASGGGDDHHPHAKNSSTYNSHVTIPSFRPNSHSNARIASVILSVAKSWSVSPVIIYLACLVFLFVCS